LKSGAAERRGAYVPDIPSYFKMSSLRRFNQSIFQDKTNTSNTQLLLAPPSPTDVFETNNITLLTIVWMVTFIMVAAILINEALILYEKEFMLFPSPFRWITAKYASYQRERNMNLPFHQVKAKQSPYVAYSQGNPPSLPHCINLDGAEKGFALFNRKSPSSSKLSQYSYEPVDIAPETRITIFALVEETNKSQSHPVALPNRPPPASE
jgi:hypothetical protein